MELLHPCAAMDAQRDWNHFRLAVEDAHDPGVAILDEGSHRLGCIHNLKGVERRRQSGQHFGLIHGQVDGTKLQQGMSASQQPLGVNVGHSAGGLDIHIATHQNCADRGSSFHWFWLFIIAH